MRAQVADEAVGAQGQQRQLAAVRDVLVVPAAALDGAFVRDEPREERGLDARELHALRRQVAEEGEVAAVDARLVVAAQRPLPLERPVVEAALLDHGVRAALRPQHAAGARARVGQLRHHAGRRVDEPRFAGSGAAGGDHAPGGTQVGHQVARAVDRIDDVARSAVPEALELAHAAASVGAAVAPAGVFRQQRERRGARPLVEPRVHRAFGAHVDGEGRVARALAGLAREARRLAAVRGAAHGRVDRGAHARREVQGRVEAGGRGVLHGGASAPVTRTGADSTLSHPPSESPLQ